MTIVNSKPKKENKPKQVNYWNLLEEGLTEDAWSRLAKQGHLVSHSQNQIASKENQVVPSGAEHLPISRFEKISQVLE